MILGVVLAGGRSSRFGSDKADALWRGRPLIDHALDALRPVVDGLAVCGRAHDGYPTIADRPVPDMGPLGGLNGALHHAAAHGFAGVLSVGCDTPLLPRALLDRLAGSDAALFVETLPVIGYWPSALASALDAFLAEDRKHAIRAWAEAAGAAALDWPPLPNVNRPEDLARL